MTETAHTVSRTPTDTLYDHMNPDRGFYAPHARGAAQEPAVDDIRTDPTNVLAQEEHGP